MAQSICNILNNELSREEFINRIVEIREQIQAPVKALCEMGLDDKTIMLLCHLPRETVRAIRKEYYVRHSDNSIMCFYKGELV